MPNNMQQLDADRLTELWNDPRVSRDDLCRCLNASYSKIRKSAILLGLESNRMGCNTGRRPEDPTPEEIEARCEMIRSAWSDDERTLRSGRLPRALLLQTGVGR